MKQVVLQFPPGSAAGPTGLRPQHVQDVLRGAAGTASLLLEALDSFVGEALGGLLPPAIAPYLCSARLIPLRKGAVGEGVRPIAIGDFLRRLTIGFACRQPETRNAISCP